MQNAKTFEEIPIYEPIVTREKVSLKVIGSEQFYVTDDNAVESLITAYISFNRAITSRTCDKEFSTAINTLDECTYLPEETKKSLVGDIYAAQAVFLLSKVMPSFVDFDDVLEKIAKVNGRLLNVLDNIEGSAGNKT